MIVAAALEQRAFQVVADVFGVPLERVTLKTSHQDVANWDSLNILNLLMAIEAEFNVSVSPEEAADFVNVERIMELLRAKGVK